MKFKKNQVVEYKGGDYFVDRTAPVLKGIPAFIKKKECCIFLKTLEDDNDLALVSVFKINEKGDAVEHRFSIRMDCLRVYHSNSKDFQIGDLNALNANCPKCGWGQGSIFVNISSMSE